MAEMVQVICAENEVEYFCKDDWTGQISLIRREKLDYTRDSMAYLERASRQRLALSGARVRGRSLPSQRRLD